MHEGKRNIYSFIFNNAKIVFLLKKEIILKQDLNTYLLSKKQFRDFVTKTKMVYILLGKDSHRNSKIPKVVTLILEEFLYLFPNKLPQGSLSLRVIQH